MQTTLGRVACGLLVGSLVPLLVGGLTSPAEAKPVTTTTTTRPVVTTTTKPPKACSSGYVSLSFDDSPTALTPTLLSKLRSLGVKATFFDVGQRAQQYPNYVRDQVSAGDPVGNHSYDHPDLVALGEPGAYQELSQTQQILQSISVLLPQFFRPPYGSTNDQVGADAAALGLTEVIWTVDTLDWSSPPVSSIVAAALTVQPGGFILMHDGYQNTVQALPQIISGLTQRGLCAGKIVPSTVPTQAWEGLSFNATVAPWTTPTTASTTTTSTTTTSTTAPTTTTSTTVPPPACPSGYVSLLFGDSPTALTPTLLSTMHSLGVRATFFDVGQRAQQYPSSVLAQVSAGNAVGNLTTDHADLVALGEPAAYQDIAQTQAILQSISGVTPQYFQPPYGSTNSQVAADAAALGLTEVVWTVDTGDWASPPVSSIVAAVLTVQPGGFILMHDGYQNTVQALPQITSGLAQRGLCAGKIVASSVPTQAWPGVSFDATVAPW